MFALQKIIENNLKETSELFVHNIKKP